MKVIGNTDDFNWNESIWRYLKPERFTEFLDTRSLYFASARQFEDRFEGAIAVMPPDFPVDHRYTEPDHAERAFEQLKRLTKICCWHRSTYESDAMWQLYTSKKKGVAICTTPERIREAVKPFRLAPMYGEETLLCGNIQYVDLLREKMKLGMEERFFYKHMAFSWEKEFRTAISVRMAEEFAVEVPELGIKVELDPSALIERIFLGPSLTPEEVELIKASAKQHGLVDKVHRSSLLGHPRYI